MLTYAALETPRPRPEYSLITRARRVSMHNSSDSPHQASRAARKSSLSRPQETNSPARPCPHPPWALPRHGRRAEVRACLRRLIVAVVCSPVMAARHQLDPRAAAAPRVGVRDRGRAQVELTVGARARAESDPKRAALSVEMASRRTVQAARGTHGAAYAHLREVLPRERRRRARVGRGHPRRRQRGGGGARCARAKRGVRAQVTLVVPSHIRLNVEAPQTAGEKAWMRYGGFSIFRRRAHGRGVGMTYALRRCAC